MIFPYSLVVVELKYNLCSSSSVVQTMKRDKKKMLRKVFSLVLCVLCVLTIAGVGVSAVAQPVYAATDYASTITEWLPLIVQFAMLGMIMGLLKKFGKW